MKVEAIKYAAKKGFQVDPSYAESTFTEEYYRRKKNNSYCKSILIHDDNTFIGKTLLREYNIKNKTNFPMKLSLNSFNQQLEIIGKLAGFDFKLTSKMARKTLASLYYFDYKLPVSDIQSLLGHKDLCDTMHYRRIEENDVANRMKNQIIKAV